MRLVLLFLKLTACCLFAALIGQPVSGEKPKAEALKASEILDRMAEAYADCKSYRDSGVVKTVFISDSDNYMVEKSFLTAFVRPDRFRFEYKEKDERYIVWRNGKDVRTWWDIKPGVEKPKSLGLAVAGATGVSGGSAHKIPRLLLPKEIGGTRLTDLSEATRAQDVMLDKVDCFRIDGKFGDSPMSLWIDKKTYLVRRIEEKRMFDTFRREQTTTYDPVVDREIPEKALEFDPPKAK